MADSIEAAITSSISSLPGSEASSGGGASVSDTDTSGDTGTVDTPTGSAGSTGSVAAPGDTAAVAQPATDAVAPVSPADDSLEGLKAELAGKRDNRIPYSRVTKIVENAEKKAEQRVRAEVDTELAQYRTPEFRNERAAMHAADTAPDKFLQALAQTDPRYADLLAGSKVLGGGGAVAPTAAERGRKPAPAGNMDPDIQLGDGTLGFSADVQMRREEALVARLEEMFDQRLADSRKDIDPILQERRVGELRREASERVSKRIARAEKMYPGFSDNREAIGAAIDAASKRGEPLSLEDAYIQVVMAKNRTDEATVRAKIHAEMNAAPAGTTRIAAAGAAKVEDKATDSDEDPITAAIKASIRR